LLLRVIVLFIHFIYCIAIYLKLDLCDMDALVVVGIALPRELVVIMCGCCCP
jgi:hypothetical protein